MANMMKAAVFLGKGRIEIVEKKSLMSARTILGAHHHPTICGTDMHILKENIQSGRLDHRS